VNEHVKIGLDRWRNRKPENETGFARFLRDPLNQRTPVNAVFKQTRYESEIAVKSLPFVSQKKIELETDRTRPTAPVPDESWKIQGQSIAIG